MRSGPACCDLGSDPAHPYHTAPPHTYVDGLGFSYALCDRHYAALVRGLAHARRPDAHPAHRGGYAHREYRRRSTRCPG
jgi:hypothetical protein